MTQHVAATPLQNAHKIFLGRTMVIDLVRKKTFAIHWKHNRIWCSYSTLVPSRTIA